MMLLTAITSVDAQCSPCAGTTEYSSNLLAMVTLPTNVLLEGLSLSGQTLPCSGIKLALDAVPTATCGPLDTLFESIADFQTGCCAEPGSCEGPLAFVGVCGFCFSGRSQVQVQGEPATTQMDKLKIGDKVLTKDGSYAEVYSFGHYQPNVQTEFLEIHTNSHKLEITADHMLYVHNAHTDKDQVVPAGQVQMGDSLVTPQGRQESVTSIRTIQRRGAYAPLTTTGDLVVDGVAVSNYVTRDWMPSFVSGQTMHMIQHGGIVYYRIYCSWFSCHDESYDSMHGYSPWVKFGFQVEGWVRQMPQLFRSFILIFGVLPVLLLDFFVGSFLAAPLWSLTHLLLLGYFAWKIGKYTCNRKGCGNPKTDGIEA